MYKEHIVYTDFDGNQQEEDDYFNLSKTELAQLELKSPGGFEGMVRRMIETTDVPKLTELFEKIVLESYGEKSADGKHFYKKGGELAKEFVDSAAYDALYTKLITDTNALIAFINGIVPNDLREQANSPEAQKKIEELKKEYHVNADLLQGSKE